MISSSLLENAGKQMLLRTSAFKLSRIRFACGAEDYGIALGKGVLWYGSL
jgi:hypothetical protein